MRYLILLTLFSVLMVGCAESTDAPSAENSAAAAEPMNEYCPIMGGEVTDDGGRTEWNGKTIGFCCPECKPKWEALSEEEKAQKLAAADEQTEPHAHEHGEDHDHGADHDGEHGHS